MVHTEVPKRAAPVLKYLPQPRAAAQEHKAQKQARPFYAAAVQDAAKVPQHGGCEQNARQRKQHSLHVIAGRPARHREARSHQFRKVMIGQGIAGKAQVLRGKPQKKALRIAHVPEKILLGHHGAARGNGQGEAKRAAHTVQRQQAQHSRTQPAFSRPVRRAQGCKQRPALCPKPGQPRGSQKPRQPEGPPCAGQCAARRKRQHAEYKRGRLQKAEALCAHRFGQHPPGQPDTQHAQSKRQRRQEQPAEGVHTGAGRDEHRHARHDGPALFHALQVSHGAALLLRQAAKLFTGRTAHAGALCVIDGGHCRAARVWHRKRR